jgi:hypothetical protein
MKTPRWPWILFAAAASTFAIVEILSSKRSAVYAAAFANEQRLHSELGRLENERRRLESTHLPPEELQRLVLRHDEASRLRARLAVLQNKASYAALATPVGGKEELLAKDWSYCGQATPKAALESVLWAASHGDVERLAGLLNFASDARPEAEALFAGLPEVSKEEYGSPEMVVATLLSGNFPKEASSATFVGGGEWGEQAAVSMAVEHADGQSSMNVFRLNRTADGWSLEVPRSVMAGYEKILSEEPDRTGSTAQ